VSVDWYALFALTVAPLELLVSTIVAWNMALDWLSFRSATARRLIEPSVVSLVRNGRILHRNLRREFLSVDELLAQLRQHGLADVSQVADAYLESDGVVSVIPRGRARAGTRPRRRRGDPGG
jgi:uncharacterized membrane protein YcaP (DUF421 family)